MPVGQTLAVFVDGGYLRAEGAKRLGLAAKHVRVDAAAVVRILPQVPGIEASLLRTYWYDGRFPEGHEHRAAQTHDFMTLERTPGLQLRLGAIRPERPKGGHAFKKALEAEGIDPETFSYQLRPQLRQKGVDTLIVLDLVRLAQKRVIQHAVLVSGDDDLAEAVRVAQDEGCRVHLACPPKAGLGLGLARSADTITHLEKAQIAEMLPPKDAEEQLELGVRLGADP